MKEHFKEYIEIFNQILEMQYKITQKKEMLYGVHAVKYGDMPKVQGHGVDIAFKIAELDDLNAGLESMKERKKQLYDKHMKEIQLVNDERYRQILRCSYLHKLSIQDISNMLNLTPNHILKLKRKAIEEFIERMHLNELK